MASTSCSTSGLTYRAEWVAATFDQLSADELDAVVKRLFKSSTIEFQPIQTGPQAEML